MTPSEIIDLVTYVIVLFISVPIFVSIVAARRERRKHLAVVPKPEKRSE